jgi:aspartyl-tRNA(Asn)/glutamyl-tRNA(Gln) amidotransferase subunit C
MDNQTLEQIANLSQLHLSGQESEISKALSDIFKLINQMENVDIKDATPLNFPLDMLFQNNQPLRTDSINQQNIEQTMLINAPLSKQNLYLVPKVID